MAHVPFVNFFTMSKGLGMSKIYGSVRFGRFRFSSISDVACPLCENGVLLPIYTGLARKRLWEMELRFGGFAKGDGKGRKRRNMKRDKDLASAWVRSTHRTFPPRRGRRASD